MPSPATGITAFKFAIFIFTCLVAKHAVLQNCTCHKSIGTDNTRILPGHLPAKFLNSLSPKRIHTTSFYQQFEVRIILFSIRIFSGPLSCTARCRRKAHPSRPLVRSPCQLQAAAPMSAERIDIDNKFRQAIYFSTNSQIWQDNNRKPRQITAIGAILRSLHDVNYADFVSGLRTSRGDEEGYLPWRTTGLPALLRRAKRSGLWF